MWFQDLNKTYMIRIIIISYKNLAGHIYSFNVLSFSFIAKCFPGPQNLDILMRYIGLFFPKLQWDPPLNLKCFWCIYSCLSARIAILFDSHNWLVSWRIKAHCLHERLGSKGMCPPFRFLRDSTQRRRLWKISGGGERKLPLYIDIYVCVCVCIYVYYLINN